MRNEERISEVLNANEAYWYEHPDLRLGQLIDNLADRDTFAIEDVELSVPHGGGWWSCDDCLYDAMPAPIDTGYTSARTGDPSGA